MKIAVIGDGAWGTALALNLLENRHDVWLWGAFPDYLEEVRQRRENFKFLKGITIPNELQLSGDINKVLMGAELAVLSTPTQFLRPVLKKMHDTGLVDTVPVVNVAKGIEVASGCRISELVKNILGRLERFAVLSGPSHAEEVARRIPTAVSIAAYDLELGKKLQHIFMNDCFRVYTISDVVGLELSGALKNVYAIAGGIIDGMKLGDNPKAAMMTRAIHELSKLGECLGGCRTTFSGLAGVGDLIVTCCSGHSRNRFVGEELGKGRCLADILADMGMVVAEGVATAKIAYHLARKMDVETPLIDAIYCILYEDYSAPDVLRNLMTRPATSEF